MLYSEKYEEIMQGDWDDRHSEKTRRLLGVWRWKGMQEYRDEILSIITEPDCVVFDVGGALGPLGFNSVCVDIEKNTIWGAPAVSNYNLSYITQNRVNVFSSHFLEHIKEIEYQIAGWRNIVRDGYLILHVPSAKHNHHWHPDEKKEHKWAFALKKIPNDDVKTVYIDLLVEKYFDIITAEYCGDSSIMIIAKKTG